MWLASGGFPVLSLIIQTPTGLDPLDNASSSVIGYLFSLGLPGIALVALGWLMFRGWRLMSPAREAEIRAEGRADLISERDRLLTEKQAAEDQRDDALRVARDLAPLLSTFIATTGALIPILQGIIADTHARRRRGGASP